MTNQINNTVIEQWGRSPMLMKRFKTYTRNGKVFIRDYKREVKDGLCTLDLQKILNAQWSVLS